MLSLHVSFGLSLHLGRCLVLHYLSGDLLQVLPRLGILSKNRVLMRLDSLSVCASALVVKLALPIFRFLHVVLVPVHDGVVVIASRLHLVRELRMLVCDTDLFLQANLFIVKFAQTILEHLGLQTRRNG